MNNNTVTPKAPDSNSNKRKRSPKENEGKTSQKKTLRSYFHSSKDEGVQNGIEINPENSKNEGQASSLTTNEKSEIAEIITEVSENSEEIHQNCFQQKSSVSGSESLNGIDVKPDVSSINQASTSEIETKESDKVQDNMKSADEIEMNNPKKSIQESFQVASESSSAIKESKESLNETEVEAGTSSMESQTSSSTLEEKVYENKESHDSLQSVDENKNLETNPENIQENSASNELDVGFVVEVDEKLNEAEVQPETSSTSQASTSGENVNDTEGNQENILEIDEDNESEDSSQESSQNTSKSKSAVDDWRSSCHDVSSLPNKARKEGLFTDIEFVMGDGEERRHFHAHKAVLACASPVFEEMFFGPSPDERSIIETDDDPDAFEMLLEYIYTSRIIISTTKCTDLMSVCRFSLIGNKYLVSLEEEEIIDFMSNFSISENDFWYILQDNNFDSLWPLFCVRLKSFIMENAEQIISSENFLNVPKTIIDCVLPMDKLNIDEHVLLLAVTKWIYHNEEQVTSENLLKYYKHIRFSTIPSEKIMQFIDLYPEALDAETCLQILQHRHKPLKYDLPLWCTTKKRSRKNAYECSYMHDPGCSCFYCENYADDDEEEEEEGVIINEDEELYDSDDT